MPDHSLPARHVAPHTNTLLATLAYFLVLGVGLGGYFLVRHWGESQALPTSGIKFEQDSPVRQGAREPASAAKSHAGPHINVVFHVLFTMTAVIGLGYFLGKIFRYIGQPPVIGEVVAGLCLGPSLLGAISPEAMHLLIPTSHADPSGHVSASLKMISQLGVILYMFVVGLELNLNKIKDQIHAAVAISHVSIVFPFLLGAILALWLHPLYSPSDVSFTSFSLFLGVAMAITAFPVLARILTDRGMEKSRLGVIALACAAADDATAWCLLAIVVGIVQTAVGDALLVASTSLAFIGGMYLIVRPLMHSWCRRVDQADQPLSQFTLLVGLVGALLSALATEVIGIHAIFGAFLFGAMIPHQSRLANDLRTRLRDSVTILLLPAFFAYTGMRTEIGLIFGWDNWLACAAIILVATLGKFGGTLLAARATGIGWRDSAALGTLMNTRGLMELIVLNIGLDLGVISPQLFAMMVMMALITTMTTSPVLSWLLKGADERQPLHDVAEGPAAGRSLEAAPVR